MAIPFFSDLDLNKNELQNFVIHRLAIDPDVINLNEAMLWYNTSDDVLKYYDGTAIRILATGGDLVNAVTRLVAAAAANELMVSGGANRTITKYTAGSAKALVAVSSAGIVSDAVPGTDYVTGASSNAFTNKSFDAEGTGNSLSNITVTNLKSGVLVTDLSGTVTDAQVASALAIKTFTASSISTAAANNVTRDAGETTADRLLISVGAAGTRKAVSCMLVGMIKLDADSKIVQAIAGTDYVTGASSNAFTNKTIDAEGTGNSISNLKSSNFKVSALSTTISATSVNTEFAMAKAVYDFVIARIAALGVFAGDMDATAGLPTVGTGAGGAIVAGNYWRVSVAGTITGLGVLEVGDVVTAKVDAAASTGQFFVMQGNITDAVTSSSTSADTQIAIFDGATGKIIKSSLATIASDGSINIPTAAAYKINGVSVITTARKRYGVDFAVSTWVGASAPYTIVVTQSTHTLEHTSDLMVQVKDTSGNVVFLPIKIEGNGNVTLTTNFKFAGRLTIV